MSQSSTDLLPLFCAEIDEILSGAIESYGVRLGECLNRAYEQLQGPAYRKLCDRLYNRGVKKADLEACRAVALPEGHPGKLHKQLFFCGVSHPKLIRLPYSDQELLVSGVQFDLRTGEDKFVKKTWELMNDDERRQLIGLGRKILTWQEQELPGAMVKNEIVWNFSQAKYEDSTLRVEGGTQRGKISRQATAASLFKAGNLESYIKDLQDDLRHLKVANKAAAYN